MNDLFLNRMKEYLKDEYETYLNTLSLPAFKGIRINTSKISVDDFMKLEVIDTRPSKICKESFYIDETTSGLGNHPAHLCGLFYMQEPSASSAVEVLDVKKNDYVLDMCSAPGGKSSQIAAKLDHSGLLVSNEIEWKRAQVLLSNMERLGFSNNMIVSAHPTQIAQEFEGFFDKVLVDAPCSGEGMFKKHLAASSDWSVEHVKACAQRQSMILDSAYECLKQDGILVYSTCTYSSEENEEVIRDFLNRYPDMELVDCDVEFGRVGFDGYGIDASKVRRIFPMDQGEGHFVAKLKKHGSSKQAKIKYYENKAMDKILSSFLQDQLKAIPNYFIELDSKIYISDIPFIKLKKIKVLRSGILVGERVKNRIEPHQHFYVACKHQDLLKYKQPLDEQQLLSYLQGNPISIAYRKGYVALCYHDYVIGFGKSDGMMIKNKYPKGMRLKGVKTC